MSQLEDQPARWIELPLHRMISQAQRDWSALSASSDVKEASTTVQIGEDPAAQESTCYSQTTMAMACGMM